MLRSIGSVAVLVLLMVGCGGGSSGGGGGGGATTYTVGGTVTGLTGSGLVLQNAGGDDLPISAPGAFTFATGMPSGANYAVTVKVSPASPAQVCTVAGGAGTIATSNVTSVDVTCLNAHEVSGTVSGLVGSGLSLAICTFQGFPGGHGGSYVCGSPLQVSANGAFTLGGAYPPNYAGPDRVQVTQQPASPTQHCAVANPLVANQVANDASVSVSCAEYSYVTNFADNTVSAYAVDAATGTLAIAGTPVGTGASPSAIVGTSDKRFVFVANGGSNDISAFTVDPATGALTAAPGSPFPAGANPQAMVVIDSLAGPEYLFVTNAGSDNFSAFDIDATGALSHRSVPATPFGTTGKGPTSIAVPPNGGWVYVANHGGSNDISVSPLGSGIDVPGSPFPAGGNPLCLAFGAKGLFLYTANPDATNPTISGFSVDPGTGALFPLPGSPFPIPVSHYIAIDQTGAYLYVTSGAGILGYGIDPTTGALTALPGFPVAAGTNAYSISIDPTNQFLYVANEGAANVSGFGLDASTGALTPMASSPFPAGNHPEFIATP